MLETTPFSNDGSNKLNYEKEEIMRKTEIQQVSEVVTVDSNLEGQSSSNSEEKLQQTEVHKEQTITELEKRLVQEAVSAVEKTKQAIAALEKNDNDAAIKAIEQAIGELDVILARDPDLALLPTDYEIVIVNMALEDEKTIKDIRREIKSAVNFGYLAVARKLLNRLKSEICVIVTNLPLVSYPDALKLAVRLIDEGKAKEATEVLKLALSTLVLEEEYLPIPLIKAHKLIEDASSESDKDRAMQLLVEAYTQLRLSQKLGYAEADNEYDELKTELRNLEKQLKTGEHNHHTFRELKTKVADFFQRISKAKK
ncbi:MAG: YfdX family protein [Pleurocapsa sp. MO_192.B19]|nr:YfdX family protein [Pleurocapsa sp. MO_192.B19]